MIVKHYKSNDNLMKNDRKSKKKHYKSNKEKRLIIALKNK